MVPYPLTYPPMDEKREPLLSDYDSILDCDDTDSDGWHTYYERSAMDKLWRFYESKITSGELRVVEEVEIPADVFNRNIIEHPDTFQMSCCGINVWLMDGFREWKYCPGCGSRIKTQD